MDQSFSYVLEYRLICAYIHVRYVHEKRDRKFLVGGSLPLARIANKTTIAIVTLRWVRDQLHGHKTNSDQLIHQFRPITWSQHQFRRLSC